MGVAWIWFCCVLLCERDVGWIIIYWSEIKRGLYWLVERWKAIPSQQKKTYRHRNICFTSVFVDTVCTLSHFILLWSHTPHTFFVHFLQCKRKATCMPFCVLKQQFQDTLISTVIPLLNSPTPHHSLFLSDWTLALLLCMKNAFYPLYLRRISVLIPPHGRNYHVMRIRYLYTNLSDGA